MKNEMFTLLNYVFLLEVLRKPIITFSLCILGILFGMYLLLGEGWGTSSLTLFGTWVGHCKGRLMPRTVDF